MAEVVGIDPCGVGEQEQREGDLGQSVHGMRSIATSTTAQGPLHRNSPAATNTIGPVTSSRSTRPDTSDQHEQEDDEGDQCAGGHADPIGDEL